MIEFTRGNLLEANVDALVNNRFEALKGKFAGKHSIRINDQWRIVFRWTAMGPEEVEITDYH
jgi:plasmid maintenance system killer protein